LRADVSLGPDNRSRGYGTVLLATAEDAGRAVDLFNGYSWQTRILEVRLDRLLPEFDLLATSSSGCQAYLAPPSSSSYQGPSPPTHHELEFVPLYHANDPCRNLFVGNVSNFFTPQSMAAPSAQMLNIFFHRSFFGSFHFIANGKISKTCFAMPELFCVLTLLWVLTAGLEGLGPLFLRPSMTLCAPSRCSTGTSSCPPPPNLHHSLRSLQIRI